MNKTLYCAAFLIVLTASFQTGCRKKAPEAGTVAVSTATVSGIQEAPPAQADPITQGLWWLYHQQYAKAREVFSSVAQADPQDPAGPFYKTATDWWELAQDFDLKMPAVEKRFAADAEETVKRAQAILKKSTGNKRRSAEAHLYWGGAQGLQGRWLVTQSQWMKAYSAGKEGHKHLKKALDIDPSLHDANLGLGIYDYYTDILPGFMGALSKLVMRGDRKRGMQELHAAMEKGGHSRVEASIFLIEIYSHEEKQPEKALALAEQLRQEFPQSPAMNLSVILMLNQLRRWTEMGKEAEDFLKKAEAQTPFYTQKEAIPGRYFAGLAAFMGRRDFHRARELLNPLIQEAPNSRSRWITFALLRRGQSYDAQGERAKAKADYRKVLARPDVWKSHEDAKRYLEKPFKLKPAA